MKTLIRVLAVWLVLLPLGSTAWAQDDGDEGAVDPTPPTTLKRDWPYLWAIAELWVAKPTGLEYRPGTRLDPDNPFGTSALELDHSNNSEIRWTVGFGMPNTKGAVELIYYSNADQSGLVEAVPGFFFFGETTTAPFLQGVFNDGTSDSVNASSQTTLRDLRLDYSAPAFSGKRITGRWYVGLRRVTHQRSLGVTYAAVAANLPPLIPPAVDPARFDLMRPLADNAFIASDFEGRGPEAGFRLNVPLIGKKVFFDAEFGLAILRGEADTTYNSRTHFYGVLGDNSEVLDIINPPYDVLLDPVDPNDPSKGILADSVRQVQAASGLQGFTESMTGDVIDIALGFRWLAWKGLEFDLGWRSTRYSNVGVDLVPSLVVPESGNLADEFTADGTPILRLNALQLERTLHSAVYEGLYLGIGYRY